MTAEKWAVLAMGLKSIYNFPGFLATEATVKIWYEALKDLDDDLCEAAVNSYIATEEKTPTPASIRKKAFELTQKAKGPELSEMEAWAIVGNAIRDSAYHAQERFDAFPEAIKKAVGSPENLRAWGLDENYNENVAQSHFLKSYRATLEREEQNALLPPNVRELIGAVKQNMIAQND